MQCFYHPDQSALGTCKHCQRGLCADCLAIVEDSLACQDRHEEQVAGLNTLNPRNLLQAQGMGSNYRRNAVFYFLSGALFAGFGLYQFRFAGFEIEPGVTLLLIFLVKHL